MIDALLRLDAGLARWCMSLAGWPPLDAAVGALTLAGVQGALWIVIGVALAVRRRGFVVDGFVRLLWSVVLAGLVVSQLAKPLVGRGRPDGTHLTRSGPAAFATRWTGGYSFPSGHAAQAVAGAYALSFMWPRRRAWLWGLALAMATSRVYLGVHYPLDIAAGGAIGWALARLATARAPCYISGSARAVPGVPR
jgi:membrane-associated phospholipid phosphatase